MEHDITTTGAEHDMTTATTGAEHDITDVAAVERDGTTATTEGSATPAAVPEGHALRPVPYVSVPPDVWALARAVAAVLDETMPPPIRTITRAVDRLGPARARAVLGQALTVEAQGGLTLPDGRRRTPGGVFFHLVRAIDVQIKNKTPRPAATRTERPISLKHYLTSYSDEISREDKDYIFPRQGGRLKRTGGTGTPAAPAPAAPAPVAWTDATFRALARQLQQDPGRATTVKITVIGRPGAIVEQGQVVAVALVSEKVPDLPKGLPEPAAGTRYTIFIARKQWAKVAEALAADPEDAAIIEGHDGMIAVDVNHPCPARHNDRITPPVRVCEKSWDRRLPAGKPWRASGSVMTCVLVSTGAA